jgi:hypothetical protein
MIVDCDTCPVRGTHCGDCVVTVLMSPASAGLPLDPLEQKAVATLVEAGLVDRSRVVTLTARREPRSPVRAVG